MNEIKKDIKRLQDDIQPLIQEFLDKHGRCAIDVKIVTHYTSVKEETKLVNRTIITVNITS